MATEIILNNGIRIFMRGSLFCLFNIFLLTAIFPRKPNGGSHIRQLERRDYVKTKRLNVKKARKGSE